MCEDYPCCGHTATDPCEAQWYDAPDAFDQTKNPHCFCEHEYGICDVPEDYYDDEDEDLGDYDSYAEDYGDDEGFEE